MIIEGEPRVARYLFAHGAGAAMDSPFMERVAAGIADAGIEVVRFEFPYMASRRDGTRRPPDREATLLATWRTRVEEYRGGPPLFIGGKSMGGRIATMIADEAGVAGVICFGYPFHPPGKPASLRTAHLETIRTPILVIQGTRDALGSREEVVGYSLSPRVRFVWIEDGDHSLKPRKSSSRTGKENLDEAIRAAIGFMAAIAASP